MQIFSPSGKSNEPRIVRRANTGGLVDRQPDRRKLLLAGLIGMAVSLVVVGGAFQFIAAPHSAGPSTAGLITLIGLVEFIMSFAFSLGPVVWTVINEMSPGRIRGRAVVVCTAVNWGSAFLVSQFFLTLVGGSAVR